VDTVYRKFKLSARQAVDKFGEENLSEMIKESLRDRPYDEFDFIHAVFPVKEAEDAFPEDARFASYYFEPSGKKILKKGHYRSFPYAVWRWRVDSHEVYGRSPAFDALWDVKGLNRMAETMIMAAQKAADPPLQIPAEMKNKVRNVPSGANYYEDPGRMIQPLVTGANYPIGIDQQNQKMEAVKQHFKVDFFLMLAEANREMTATEIMERQSEKVAVLGATIGAFTGALGKIIDRTYEIELEAGRIPPVTEDIAEISEANIDIEYLGPLAQAQKRLSRSQGIMRSLEALMPIMQVNQDVGMNIDWHELAREIMTANGMPENIVRSRDEVEQELAQRAQMAQQEMQRQSLETLGKSNALNQRPEAGSVMAQMTGAENGLVPQGAG